MSNTLLTVHEAAQKVGLHPKTVLRCIHDGRLRATRIGKSYRILPADLDAFSGADKARPETIGKAQVTAMVEIYPISVQDSERLATVLNAVTMGRDSDAEPISIGTSYFPREQRLKIMLGAGAADAAHLLRLVEVQRERLE